MIYDVISEIVVLQNMETEETARTLILLCSVVVLCSCFRWFPLAFTERCQMRQKAGSVSTYRSHSSVIKVDPVLL